MSDEAKVPDQQKVNDLMKIVETKMGELVHRHRTLAMAFATNDTAPLHFFAVMTRESARAVEFWLGQIESELALTGCSDE